MCVCVCVWAPLSGYVLPKIPVKLGKACCQAGHDTLSRTQSPFQHLAALDLYGPVLGMSVSWFCEAWGFRGL